MTSRNLLIVSSLILICAILFWPTLYRYETFKAGEFSTPIRINRITGHTERYTPLRGWVSHEGTDSETNGEALPPSDIDKITGNASLSGEIFSGDLYNGSDWTITSIRFRLVPKSRDGSVMWDRKFNALVTIEPLTSRYFSISVTGGQGASTTDWYIDEARGRRNK